MPRNGQITLFIVLGIILLLGFGVLFYVNASSQRLAPESTAPAAAVDELRSYVDDCLKTSAEEGIQRIGVQGGYHDQPEDSIELSDHFVPIYFTANRTEIPSLERIQHEYQTTIERNLDSCLGNYSFLISRGYKVQAGSPTATVVFAQDNTQIELSYPITLTVQRGVTQLNQFSAAVDVRFLPVYGTLQTIQAEQQKTPNYAPVGGLTAIANADRNISFGLAYLSHGLVSYSLTFNSSRIGGHPYVFMFAGSYDWPGEQAQLVKIQRIGRQQAHVGYTFSYQVNATGNQLTYSDTSSVFHINRSTGLISFTPTNQQEGDYFIAVTATDNESNTATQQFELQVMEGHPTPYLFTVPTQRAFAGQRFTYRVRATAPDNSSLFVLDDSPLFNISRSGIINFTPRISERGMHIVNITAISAYGRSYSRPFDLVIT